MDTRLIEQEIHRLDTELKFEKDETRKTKLHAYKKALEWVLEPLRRTNPCDL